MATEQHNVNDIGGIKLPPPNEIAKAVLSAPIKGVVFTELKDLSKQKDIVVKECIDLLAPFMVQVQSSTGANRILSTYGSRRRT